MSNNKFKSFKRLKRDLSYLDRFIVIVHNRDARDKFIQFALEELIDQYEYKIISVETDVYPPGKNNKFSYSYIKIDGITKYTISEDIIGINNDTVMIIPE